MKIMSEMQFCQGEVTGAGAAGGAGGI